MIICKVALFVLIETLWNVNYDIINGSFIFDIVLIETLWNVNLESTGIPWYSLLY